MRLCHETDTGLRSSSTREETRFAVLLDAQVAMIARSPACVRYAVRGPSETASPPHQKQLSFHF
jgi:hypothetical protein